MTHDELKEKLIWAGKVLVGEGQDDFTRGHISARLPDSTRVFPGHEYMARNLEFTLDREPDNAQAAARVAMARHQEPAAMPVTTLGEEKLFNTFLRLQSPTVMARLAEQFPQLGAHPDAKTVFLKLRELRNKW